MGISVSNFRSEHNLQNQLIGLLGLLVHGVSLVSWVSGNTGSLDSGGEIILSETVSP